MPADSRAAPAGHPFRFLQETEAEKLVRVLGSERPQTIALVLSHLSPVRAGAVLARLPENVQVDVIHRLVDLEETDPEILREVEEALRSRLSQQVRDAAPPRGRLAGRGRHPASHRRPRGHADPRQPGEPRPRAGRKARPAVN